MVNDAVYSVRVVIYPDIKSVPKTGVISGYIDLASEEQCGEGMATICIR